MTGCVNDLVDWSVDGPVGRVRLCRAVKRNALDHRLVDGVLGAAAELERAGALVAVLEAEPPVFCAGVDLTVPIGLDRDGPDLRLLDGLTSSPLLWVAAVDGPALAAGMAVAAACPVVVASERAWFALPERDLLLFPGRVLSYLEPVLGPRHALQLALTGERLSAEQAHHLGLVGEVVSVDRFDTVVARRAAELAAPGPAFVTAARTSWQAVFDGPVARGRAEGFEAGLRESLAARARAR